MIDRDNVESAIAEFRTFLTNDGADLRLRALDTSAGTIELDLVIGEATCEECVIEPQMLRAIITEFFTDKLPGLLHTKVHDPRVSVAEGGSR